MAIKHWIHGDQTLNTWRSNIGYMAIKHWIHGDQTLDTWRSNVHTKVSTSECFPHGQKSVGVLFSELGKINILCYRIKIVGKLEGCRPIFPFLPPVEGKGGV